MFQRMLMTCLVAVSPVGAVVAGDWPSWRGPEQTGMSREKAPVTKWSEDGENLLWKTAVGGRTTPILMNGRLYFIGPVGEGECLQERVVCLDAATGKTVWEKRFNVYHTDIVEARLGWTAMVGDTETGNVYAHLTGGELAAFDRDGKVLWNRSLGEEFGRYSGYGGRLMNPIIDEDRVVISYVYILSNWESGKEKSGHRYVAFDKRTGEVAVWFQPGERPLDTTYSAPVTAVINGKRMIIAANADGNVYGVLARTGEKVWTFKLSKRGLNASVVVDGNYVYASHSEENITGNEMGKVVCIDATKTGDITESGQVWGVEGLEIGYASPAAANGRLYVVTNSSQLVCLDAKTGKQQWTHKLGTAQRGSPLVTADGVIYVGEVNGRFHILRDAGDKCESLDVKEFERPDKAVVEINGSPILVDGRVYFQTRYHTYCLGRKDFTPEPVVIPQIPPEAGLPTGAESPKPPGPTRLYVTPAEVTLAPGEKTQFRVWSYDAHGRRLKEMRYDSPGIAKESPGPWSQMGLNGDVRIDGTFQADPQPNYSAGTVKLTIGDQTPSARVRICPRPPHRESFDKMPAGSLPPGWVGVDGKTKLVEKDGSVVLQKLAESPSAPYGRMRAFSHPPLSGSYTVQADMMGEPMPTRQSVLSDMGLMNNRYKLILLGYEKAVRLVTYSPIPRIQKDVAFDWQPNVWYRAKLSMEIQEDKAVVRGKVWPREEKEPDAWTVEVMDPCPNREGSPGLYAYTKGATSSKPGASCYFDNYQVMMNEKQ